MNDKQTVTQQDSELVEVDSFTAQSSLLDSIISQSRVARSETERTRTCLLYTSPSPRDRQKSRMPSSA